MILDLDKSTWKRVAFGDVAKASKESCDPTEGSVDHYIAGEHMDTNDLKIRRWGDVGDGYLGPAFHRRFSPGQVLYGSRRTYLRKVAVAEFHGVCANTTFVVETKDESVLMQDFLPFVMTSESFHAFSTAESKGSVNPYVNWSDLARFEFDLPTRDEQQRIADILWAIERDRGSRQRLCASLSNARRTWLHSIFAGGAAGHGFIELDSLVDPQRPVCYGVLMPGPEFKGGQLIVDVKDYPTGQIQMNTVRRCDPAIERKFTRSRLRTGDVLLSIRGTIGRVAIVPETLDGHNISRDSARISGNPAKVIPEFLQLILESPDVQDEIRRTTTGLAVKGVNVARIRALKVPNWPLDAQRTACARFGEIETALTAAEAVTISLGALRNSISQAVFGGGQ